MKADVWLWELSADYPGAGGITDDTKLPIGRMWCKTHESSLWYPGEKLTNLIRIYRDQGIEFAAWCVPTGLTDDAALAISVLNTMRESGIAEPWLQLDIEVERGAFWQGTPAQLAKVFSTIRLACPWARLAACMYQWDNALFGIDTIAPMADRLVSMSYWPDFSTTPETQLASDYRHLSFYGRPVQLGLPGNALPADMQRGLAWVKDHTPDMPPLIWRRGTVSAATWQIIRAFVMEAPPPPPLDPRDVALGEVQAWLFDDEAGAQLRRQRLADILKGATS